MPKKDAGNPIDELLIDPLVEFYKDAKRFSTACDKPNAKQFMHITKAVIIGFMIMGITGFIVKLVHIPINHIIVGGI